MPKQGVTSMFHFGESYGFLQGMLSAHKLRHDYVSPQRWKKHMGCLAPSKSTSTVKKNIDKSKAQQLFPAEKITHQIADALLIAEYCRRTENK
jgi:crossover junction endodeoxyribonuclease RuvC